MTFVYTTDIATTSTYLDLLQPTYNLCPCTSSTREKILLLLVLVLTLSLVQDRRETER